MQSQRHHRRSFVLFLAMIIATLVVFRFGFRMVRSRILPSPIMEGTVGFAQYTGYPSTFETYYLDAMMLSPIPIALILRYSRKGT